MLKKQVLHACPSMNKSTGRVCSECDVLFCLPLILTPERTPGLGRFMSSITSEEETQLDHSAHQRLTADELTEANLADAVIYGPQDEKIGMVSHLHGTGSSSQVIVDVGGFLGIGTKPVALPVSQLDFMRDENGKVHATTSLTKDEVKDLPEHHH
jgi:hypothetical protein